MDNPILEAELKTAFQEIHSDSPLADKRRTLTAILANRPQQSGEVPTIEIQLSQYSMEVLFTYVEKENSTLLKDFLFMCALSQVQITKELQPKELTMSGYFTRLAQEEKDEINKHKVLTGLDKSDYAYWMKLLKSAAPVKPVVPTGKGSKATAILPPPEEVNQHSLTNRLALLSEQGGAKQTQGTPTSLAFKLEFTQNFLSTARSQQSQPGSPVPPVAAQPSILKLGFEDYYGAVTVVETNMMLKIVLFGTSKGVIKAAVLSRAADSPQPEQGISVLKSKDFEQQPILGDAGTTAAQPAVSDEFETLLDMAEFVGHKSPITAMSLKYDSTRFVSGSLDGHIRYWDVTRNTCLYVLQEQFESILSIKMSPKRDLFASAGSEAAIILWNEASGTRHLSLAGHTKDVVCLDFTYNMRYLLSSSLDSTLRLWCTTTGECIRIIRTPSPLLHFCVTLIGDVVIGATENEELTFIDVTRYKLQRFYTFSPKDGTESRIRCVALSPDEKHLSIIKKDQVAVIPIEEVYKLKSEFEQLEKREDEAAIKELSNRDYKYFSSVIFENEKFDFITQAFGFHNSLVVFNRNPVSSG